jgi:hypothetical protein
MVAARKKDEAFMTQKEKMGWKKGSWIGANAVQSKALEIVA